MEVQVQVYVVVGAIIDDGLDHGPIGGLVRGSIGIGAAEPIVLVERKADTVGMPDLNRLGDDRYIVGHGDAADRGGRTSGSAVSGRAIFQPGNIHSHETDCTTIAVDDVVS